MRNAHAVAGVRAAEGALMALLPEGALMQRAAAGLAAACAGLLSRADRAGRPGRAGGVYGSRVVVLTGSGDNGGDALYAGARLAARGAVVTAVAAAERMHEGGAAALRGSGGRVIEAAGRAADEAIAAADLIIDGLLGIGGRGGLREPAASLAAAAGRARALVVAVDLPSGIDADTGEVAGAAVRADVTITFGTLKPGLLIDPGASHAGVVQLVDIGLGGYLGPPDVAAPQAADIAAWLPRPSAESDKYRRGVLGIVAGSDRFTGAPTLAVGGAIRGGAGMVRLVSSEVPVGVVRQHWPEAVITTRATASGAARPSRRPARWRPGRPGRAWGRTRSPPACSRRSWRPASRCWSMPTGSPCWPLTASCCRARRPPCSRRTPASSPGCSARTGRTWKPTASGSPPGPPPNWAAPCC